MTCSSAASISAMRPHDTQRQCRRDPGLGRRARLQEADHRHLELSHAAQPDRARRASCPTSELLPYPVGRAGLPHGALVARSGARPACWSSEYVKFLPSAARLGVARLLRSWDGSALAGGAATVARPRPLKDAVDAAPARCCFRGRLLRQHGRVPGARQLAAAGAAPLGHAGPAPARAGQPVVAEGHLRHAHRGARAREAARRRLPRRLQAPVGLGHLRARSPCSATRPWC